MFADTPFVICHNLGFVGGQKTREEPRQGALVTSQPSYIRASDVIYVIFLTHAQAVSLFPPAPALEPGDEATSSHALHTKPKN